VITPVILCGGSGTRLWPLSRAMFPKQFHRLVGEGTLLEETIRRVKGVAGVGESIAVCNEEFRFLTAEQFRRQQVSSFKMLLEPRGRNTAPALAVAARHVLDNNLPPLLLVLPSDHVIKSHEQFVSAVEIARTAAESGAFVTFGIRPTSAETGYGYIKAATRGDAALPVERFVEKPDAVTAQGFVDSGDYYWNSGMFLFDAAAYIEALERFEPDIAHYATHAIQRARTSGESIFLDAESFDQCPAISVDYAVMERTDRAMVVPLDAGWCDVGSWKGVWQVSEHDADGNVSIGDVRMNNVTNSCIIAGERLIVAGSLDNVAIIDTRDVTYVAALDAGQEIRDVVMALRDEKRSEVEHHPRVYRPWGSFESIDQGAGFQVKRLIVNPGAAISLQYHHHRSEHWVVVRGVALVRRGDQDIELSPNESVYIPAGMSHKLSNTGNTPLEVIEVQTGSYLGEDDIVRLEDQYGRIEEAAC
jgi:mannose-1-phosphate guanylyltransferase / mannose-6-phosphate isomerase